MLRLYRTAFICLETSLLFSACSQEMAEITPKYPEAVDFYLKLGAHLTDEPDPELLRLEPEDIHLVFNF